jgi:hypothetical protein
LLRGVSRTILRGHWILGFRNFASALRSDRKVVAGSEARTPAALTSATKATAAVLAAAPRAGVTNGGIDLSRSLGGAEPARVLGESVNEIRFQAKGHPSMTAATMNLV